jgi:N-acetylmuramoyl-L-alanine amidase
MKRAGAARALGAACCAGIALMGLAGGVGGQTVAIDVGHSIATHGAISSRGVPEFTFNRALSLVLEAELRRRAYDTVLIAADGMTADLISRPRRAADAGAAFFIAVHHDSAKARFQRDWQFEGRARKYLDDRFRGFSIFVSRENPEWPRALRCASAIGARMIEAGYRPSRYHADPVLGSGREFADEANGVHFFDGLAVLRRAAMPAVLFEAGVIVNRDEEAVLSQDATREHMARAIADGLPACIARPAASG